MVEERTEPATETPPIAVPPRKRSWLRRLAFFTGLVGFVFVGVIISIPYVASGDFVRKGIEKNLGAQLGTEVVVERHDFSFFSGLSIAGIRIENPEGFPKDQKAFVLDEMKGDVSFLSLLTGEVDLRGTVKGVEIRLYEKADGSTNFGEMFKSLPASGSGNDPDSPGFEMPKGDTSNAVDAAGIEIDLRVIDSLIEIEHETRGVLESMRHVEAGLRKLSASSAVQLSFNADLFRADKKSGRVEFVADVDSDLTNPATMRFEAKSLDLARYKSLVHSFLEPEDYPEAFAGMLSGQVDGAFKVGESVTLSGDLLLANPHFKGALFGGLDIRGEKWTFRPKLRAEVDSEFSVKSVSTEGFDVQMGFLSVVGLASAEAKEFAKAPSAAGFRFDADLRQLLDMGLTGLEGLRKGKGRATGTVTVAMTFDPATDPAQLAERWAEFVRLESAVLVDGFAQEGFTLDGFVGDAVVEKGQLVFQSRAGGKLNGGPVTVRAESKVADLAAARADMKVKWERGRVAGDAVKWLRYVVPLLDGLPLDNAAGLDLRGMVDADMVLDGPVLPKENESVLEWVNHWRGKGDLAVVDGAFTPAAVWKTVLDFADLKTPLDFSKIESKFGFEAGSVATELMKFNRAAKSWSMTGKVDLQGAIDYSIDLKQLLRGRRDGDRILKYLGEKPILARLAGTLDAPTLAAPKYEDLFKQALGGAAKGALEGLLDKKTKKKIPKGLLDLLKRK